MASPLLPVPPAPPPSSSLPPPAPPTPAPPTPVRRIQQPLANYIDVFIKGREEESFRADTFFLRSTKTFFSLFFEKLSCLFLRHYTVPTSAASVWTRLAPRPFPVEEDVYSEFFSLFSFLFFFLAPCLFANIQVFKLGNRLALSPFPLFRLGN